MTAHFVTCKCPFIFNILALLSSSQVVLVVKNPSADAGDAGSIRGSGRSPGEGIGYPCLYSWASLVAQLVNNLPAVWET